ncbi:MULTISPECIES: enoyl-CoA hydratase/isomerase family protein [unclassified Rhodococcus (in: high G+C Gram-positive bacteria)]|uniref:enoyl-CoA hydratase/isomerase family protein n=1 Tax=unclassified Rhodococcus (in: high G+C Gram-positive bacteria) TaxID=192944 RepID=UPI0016397EEB|nr:MULTISPECIES: enoyl-CoA hydratase-related protein [unclassified Rhodococcus (in: high G+C Gram-positive bacteria)]MBC2642393.1 enoyl-CoA hydratase/isomerase family protein [Rhodococcus sp. 3A]MBC2892864.1 enoyl-CoA hydratase/isomerase family protein [Rhodococcus sp. 4CII]
MSIESVTPTESDVLISRDGAIATITLNRPARRNAMTLDAWIALREALGELALDNATRVVVLTGAGGDFCSGADLDKRAPMHPLDRMRRINATAVAVAEFPKPLIAKVRGYAVGAGWNLALLCDLLIASRDAQFSQIFARRGLSVDFGGSWLLPRMVGLHPAKRLVMLAEMIDAEQADALGLVGELVDPEELDGTVARLAARLAASPTVAVMQSARLIEDGTASSLREALENEARAQAINFATDAPAAVRAFVEKRPPAFSGQWQVPQPT